LYPYNYYDLIHDAKIQERYAELGRTLEKNVINRL
jgi:hypothetical protein